MNHRTYFDNWTDLTRGMNIEKIPQVNFEK